ncbi:hypothetical protein IWX76_000675 [Pedobacter sp. CAN_A7]|uniref:hypothetical protein n=1 Tax=Pedobacter sp. CAN_A7 TaxID=2787722 RepID=UPI0018CBD151
MQEKHKKSTERPTEDLDNPGLDADHSSDTGYQKYNSDNDMVSGNSDEEHDRNLKKPGIGESPLRDK